MAKRSLSVEPEWGTQIVTSEPETELGIRVGHPGEVEAVPMPCSR
jgi:hypothetical protein